MEGHVKLCNSEKIQRFKCKEISVVHVARPASARLAVEKKCVMDSDITTCERHFEFKFVSVRNLTS